MALSMAPLLMYSAEVPASARDALRAASVASPEGRAHHLESAARILHDAGVACHDARELVGLPGGCGV